MAIYNHHEQIIKGQWFSSKNEEKIHKSDAVFLSDGNDDVNIPTLTDIVKEMPSETVNAEMANTINKATSPILTKPTQLCRSQKNQDCYDQLVAEMAIGTWLQLSINNGEQLRTRLAWRSNIQSLLVFVNRKGLKIMDTTWEALADQFRSGEAFIVDELPLMERAFSSILAILKM